MTGATLARNSPFRASISYLILSAVCVAVYFGGLFGGFLFDDFQTILANPSLQSIGTSSQNWLAIALSSDAGVLRRPISMLSFGLNIALFGVNPLAFKAVNLIIHLINGALLYAIAIRLIGTLIGANRSTIKPESLALFIAGLWLLHPLNVSDVVYIVQRMNELAMLFTLCGLLCYIDGRIKNLRGESALAISIGGLCFFGCLAVLSKENGALIVLYALVIEAICFRFDATHPRESSVIKAFFLLTVALPLVAFAGYFATHPHWFDGGYVTRDFSLYQRLLSEGRILCNYLLWIFIPNLTWMGIYHDDLSISTGLLQPTTTAISILFLLFLIIAAWKLRKRSPGITFGIAWFLTGHLMESTVLPLELVFEHRNYLPIAGLLLGISCAIVPWLAKKTSPRATAFAGMAVLLVCGALTSARAMTWGDPLTLAVTDAQHHPASSRSQYEAARAIIIDGTMKGKREEAEQEAIPYLQHSAANNRNFIHPVVELILIQSSRRTVETAEISDLAERLRRVRYYTDVNPFLDFLVTASEQQLTLTLTDVSQLVEAALANPNLPAKVRAMILNNFGAYQFNIVRDSQSAITLTTAAAAEDPKNPYFQINLANIALALKQPDEAGRHLEMAKQLDVAGTYQKSISSLQAKLK